MPKSQKVSLPRLTRIFGGANLSRRIGWWVIVGSCLTATICVIGASTSRWSPDSDFVAFLWLLPVPVWAWCGISLMRNCRQSAMIETELQRAGKNDQWRSARPLVGSDPIVSGWNALLEQAMSRSEVAAAGSASDADSSIGNAARALRSLPFGFAVTDSAGVLQSCNLPFAVLVKEGNSEDLKSRDMGEVLRLAECSNADEVRESLASNSRTISLQLNYGKSSRDGVLRLTRNRLAGRDGDSDGYVFALQDITQQVLASEARDSFLSTASHELRTPLSNLKAYAEALAIEDGIDVEEQKKFCNIINDESTRLARLVDELLAVGQMEAGSLVMHRSELDFSRVLNEAIEYVQPSIEKKELQFTANISPKLPIMNGDKDKLQAAVVNLLGNAAKYTPNGGEIHLRASADDKQLQVDIQDTGIGIAEEDLEQVFNKFYRAENDDRVSDETGNGLGLAFAREIVRRHGGDVTAESELNEGSVFTLTLPISADS